LIVGIQSSKVGDVLSAFGTSFNSFLRELDTVGIESTAHQAPESTKEFFHNVKNDLESIPEFAKKEIGTLQQEVSSSFSQFRQKVQEWASKRFEGNKERELHHLDQMKEMWVVFMDEIGQLVVTAKSKWSDQQAAALEKIANVENKAEGPLKNKWTAVKEELTNDIRSVEEYFSKETALVTNKISSLWRRFQKYHQSEEARLYRPHHGIIKCGSCGKEYNFAEFLDIFDPKHQLEVSVEHDRWGSEENDEKVFEEYYEGWTIWANYMKLKCSVCGASKWEDFVVYEDTNEKILREEL